MKLPRRRILHLAAGAAALPAISCTARAQAYPTRPVHLIVPYAPGGTTDITERLIGPWLSERLGQTFVIESRPGAATNVGTESVAHSFPDGYTLLLFDPSAAINATLFDKLNFNFVRDIAPIVLIMRTPFVIVVNPSVPAKTLPEFIAYAKVHPGRINMASEGTGSASQLAGELFKVMAGVEMTHIPYRGGGPAVTNLLGGQVDVFFAPVSTVMQYIQADKLRALAGDWYDALPGIAGCPDRRRFCVGLRCELLDWSWRAQENSWGNRHEAQQGNQCSSRDARYAVAVCTARGHCGRWFALRL